MTPGAPIVTSAPQAITSGAYLKLRREAASVSIDALILDPVDMEAIERGDRFPTDTELHALGWAFDFDMPVLIGLARGIAARLCRACGCSEWDPCWEDLAGEGSCWWVEADLCSRCTEKAQPVPEGITA